jgi:hypothetical protein
VASASPNVVFTTQASATISVAQSRAFRRRAYGSAEKLSHARQAVPLILPGAGQEKALRRELAQAMSSVEQATPSLIILLLDSFEQSDTAPGAPKRKKRILLNNGHRSGLASKLIQADVPSSRQSTGDCSFVISWPKSGIFRERS